MRGSPVTDRGFPVWEVIFLENLHFAFFNFHFTLSFFFALGLPTHERIPATPPIINTNFHTPWMASRVGTPVPAPEE
jgi:hypothetical protein